MSELLHNEFPPDSIEAKDLAHMLHPATNLGAHQRQGPHVLSHAEGAYIWDNAGKQYIEGLAGLWCTALGYGVEELAQTAYEQMKKLSYAQLFGSKTNEPSVLLAEKLKAMLPMTADRIFFGVSGSDANDTQIKLVWYYNNAIGRPEKKKIISRWKGYHGVTVASGSLTGLPPFHNHFDLPIAGVLHADAPYYYRGAEAGESEQEFSARLAANLDAQIEAEGPETVAAFIAEPVLGAGGVIVPPAGYYEAIQPVLAKHDVLLIDDEVICGFGRTGNAFGMQTMNMQPTTVSLAKAISSAYLPLSAVAIPEFMYEPFVELSPEVGNFAHGFTYTGHPVCTAVALKNLELMEERDLFGHAARMSVPFQARLKALADHPLVGDARGIGMIGAVELVASKQHKTPFPAAAGIGVAAQMAAQRHGLITRALGGDVLAFCPPLIVSEAQVHEIFDKVERALADTLEHASREGLLQA
ncbi:MAG: aminotransferase [Pseudomonadota bacterium]